MDSEVNSGDPRAQPLQTRLTEGEGWQIFPHSSAARVREVMGQTLQGKEGHPEYQDPKSGPLNLSLPLPPNHPQPKEQPLSIKQKECSPVLPQTHCMALKVPSQDQLLNFYIFIQLS